MQCGTLRAFSTCALSRRMRLIRDINLGKVFLPGPTGGIGGYSYAGSNGNLVRYDAFSVFDNAYNLSQPIFKSLILHRAGAMPLGLKHPFEDGPTLPSEYEHSKYSLMSYTTNPETGQDGDVFAVYDVYALQERWGANTSNKHRQQHLQRPTGRHLARHDLGCRWDGHDRCSRQVSRCYDRPAGRQVLPHRRVRP